VFLPLGASQAGCAPRKQAAAPTTRPLGPPVFDGRRGGGSFPLEPAVALTSAEPSPDDLRSAMEAAYHRRLIRPTTRSTAVTLTPLGPNDYRELSVQVSGWRVRSGFEPSQFAKDSKESSVYRAKRVLYSAEPLRYEQGELSVRLEAEDAVLHRLTDTNGQQALVLAGARRGELRFYAPMDQFKRVFSAGSRRGAGRAGINIRSLDIQFTSANPRQLDAVVTVEGSWLLLPLRLEVFGRMEVDDTMHANFSNLGATGTGPAGDLLAPFIDRAVKKIDGRRSPLMAFRDGKTKATDYAVRADEVFEVRLQFGQ
jgi:hypothetical protein